VIIQENRCFAIIQRITIGKTRTKGRNEKKRTGSNSSRHPSILVRVSNAGHKPLSRTITIHAINLNLSSVTRIMRARVSTSITLEIPHGLSISPIILSCPHTLRFFLSHAHLSARVSLTISRHIESIQLITNSVSSLK